jgi:hypothetical protein
MKIRKKQDFLVTLQETIVSCERVFETAATEEEVQTFLADHPFLLFEGALIGNWFLKSNHVISKLKLGSEYVTDFAVCACTQTGFHWQFIEIERPDIKLFNKQGDPTKELTHAIGQVQQWRRWVNDNSEYCKNIFAKHIKKEHFSITAAIGKAPKAWHRTDDLVTKIIIGRKASLTTENVDRLHQMNVDMKGAVEVMTFDRLLDRARNILASPKKIWI